MANTAEPVPDPLHVDPDAAVSALIYANFPRFVLAHDGINGTYIKTGTAQGTSFINVGLITLPNDCSKRASWQTYAAADALGAIYFNRHILGPPTLA